MNNFKIRMFHLNHDMMLFHKLHPNATTEEYEKYFNIDKNSDRYKNLQKFIKEFENKNELKK